VGKNKTYEVKFKVVPVRAIK